MGLFKRMPKQGGFGSGDLAKSADPGGGISAKQRRAVAAAKARAARQDAQRELDTSRVALRCPVCGRAAGRNCVSGCRGKNKRKV